MAKQVVAKVGDKLHRAVKAKAASQGKTITAVVKELLKEWVEEKHEDNEDQPRL